MVIGSGEQLVDPKMVDKGYEETDAQDNFNESAQDLFYIDMQATPVSTELPLPRVASPILSDSESDVVIFGGRDEHGRPIMRSKSAVKVISDPVSQRIQQVEQEIQQKEELLEQVLHFHPASGSESVEKIIAESTLKINDNDQVEIQEEIVVGVRPKKSKKRKQRKRNGCHEDLQQVEEDALIADYLANMDEDLDFLESFKRRELGSQEDEQWPDETEPADLGQHISRYLGWDRDQLNELDDLSTSDGVMGKVTAILSKRERKLGVQYLTVWEVQSVDEARWVPVTTLISINAQLHIDSFEAEEKTIANFEEGSVSDSEDTGSEGVDDKSTGISTPREPVRMSDAKYARLLAKQEELGIDINELVLFDGGADNQESELDEDLLLVQRLPSLSRGGCNKGQGSGKRRGKDFFPVASLLVDEYDGYNVLDMERPSLKKKLEGRKGKLAYDLSDSELDAGMKAAWQNDRVKKKERKQERAELRAQGLLSIKNGKIDMPDKYKEGMDMLDIKGEVKLFLQSEHTT